jgi:hypothetical protein
MDKIFHDNAPRSRRHTTANCIDELSHSAHRANFFLGKRVTITRYRASRIAMKVLTARLS